MTKLLNRYLASSDIVDYASPDVLQLAMSLAADSTSYIDTVKRCFNWVRNEIPHSYDCGATVVTCTASQVAREKTGICYAKSPLLAALLRSNKIPTGFCYQRLSIPGTPEGPVSLHGFNAVWLEELGWFRIDARGNTGTIDACFNPLREKLAFQPNAAWGEMDIPGVYSEPFEVVVQALRTATSCEHLWSILPDMPRL